MQMSNDCTTLLSRPTTSNLNSHKKEDKNWPTNLLNMMVAEVQI